MTLTRRQAICQLTAGTALLALGCTTRRGHRAVESLLVEMVRTLAVPDPLGVGRALLESAPELGDVETLCEQIFGGLPVETAASPAKLAQAFREQVRGELSEGRFTLADGWLLAPSEARLCVLLAADGG